MTLVTVLSLHRGCQCWCGLHDLRRASAHLVDQRIQRYPQLSPVGIHSSTLQRDEIPPGRQPIGTGPHGRAHLPAHSITGDSRTTALRGGDGKMHGTRRWVGHGTQGQRPMPQRANAAKAGETGAFGDATDHADKRARPLERRDRNTARPPLVFIRLRNPCFLARRRLLGWNVRFTPVSSSHLQGDWKQRPQARAQRANLHRVIHHFAPCGKRATLPDPTTDAPGATG